MIEKREKRVLGWREWVTLPELGISWVKVKVDTGARSSALHAYDVERYQRAGRAWVRFKVHPLQRNISRVVEATAPLFDQRDVRSSSGQIQSRYFIETTIELGGERWPIELTLVGRDEMGFRMLLGRQAVKGKFVVDPGRSFRLGRGPKGPRTPKRRSGK
jgi:hypothetical protein